MSKNNDGEMKIFWKIVIAIAILFLSSIVANIITISVAQVIAMTTDVSHEAINEGAMYVPAWYRIY